MTRNRTLEVCRKMVETLMWVCWCILCLLGKWWCPSPWLIAVQGVQFQDEFWWWNFDWDFWGELTFNLTWHFGNVDYTRDTRNPKLQFGIKISIFFRRHACRKKSMCSSYFDPPWNFQHRMGGHVPGINHHSVPGNGLPKKWPWVLSFCRGHFCILEGLILYTFFHRLIL